MPGLGVCVTPAHVLQPVLTRCLSWGLCGAEGQLRSRGPVHGQTRLGRCPPCAGAAQRGAWAGHTLGDLQCFGETVPGWGPDPARGVSRRALEEAATRPEASDGHQASFFRLSQVGGVSCNRWDTVTRPVLRLHPAPGTVCAWGAQLSVG